MCKLRQQSIAFFLLLALAPISVAQANECDRPQTSEEVAHCLGNELRQSDVKINDIYQQLMARLDETDRKKLREEQRAWLKERDEVCILDRRETNREKWLREILKDYRKTVCVTRYARYRTAELEKLLADQKSVHAKPNNPSNQLPQKTEQSKYQIVSPSIRTLGHWYFDVTVNARDIARLGLNALWLGCWEGKTNTSVGTLVQVRDVKGASGNVRYGFALDLDAGRLYISVDGAWPNGEPGSMRGVATQAGGEYKCGAESTMPIGPLIERGLLTVNYGIPHSFPYHLPLGYLAFDASLGNFVSYHQMELQHLSNVWPEDRNYNSPLLPSREAVGKEESIRAMAANHDRGLLALGYESGDVVVFDLVNGKEFRRFKAHPHRIGTLRFSQSGSVLFSNSEFDTVAKVWNVETGEKLKSFEIGPMTGKGSAFDFGDPGWIFASDQGPLIYDLIGDKLIKIEDGSHAQSLSSVAVDSMSHRIVGGGGPLVLYQYGGNSGGDSVPVKKLAETQETNPKDWILAVVFAADKRSVYSISRFGNVNRWDARDLSLIAHFDLGVNVHDVAIKPDGSRFVVAGSKRSIDGLCADWGAVEDRAGIIEFNTQDGTFRRASPPILLYQAAAYLGTNRLVVGAGNETTLLDLATFRPPQDQPDRIGVGKLNFCSKSN